MKLVVLQEWLRPTSVSILPIAKPYTGSLSRQGVIRTLLAAFPWLRETTAITITVACIMRVFFLLCIAFSMLFVKYAWRGFPLFSWHFHFLIIYSEICILIIMCRLQVD